MSLAKVLFNDWHLIHSCCLIFWKYIRTILLANFHLTVVSEEAVTWSFLFLIPEVFLFLFENLLFLIPEVFLFLFENLLFLIPEVFLFLFKNLLFLWFCTLQARNLTYLDRHFQSYICFTFHPHTIYSTTLSSRTYRCYLFSFYTWARDRRSDKRAKPQQWRQSAMW